MHLVDAVTPVVEADGVLLALLAYQQDDGVVDHVVTLAFELDSNRSCRIGREHAAELGPHARHRVRGPRSWAGRAERLRQDPRLVGAALVVQVAHRCLDVGVAHPVLDLDDRGVIDGERAEGVPEVVEPERR